MVAALGRPAARAALGEDRMLMIIVRFGSWPGSGEIDEINELGASLTVASWGGSAPCGRTPR